MAKVEGRTDPQGAAATTAGEGSKNNNNGNCDDPLLPVVDHDVEDDDEEDLGIDPTLLASLSEGERREALAAARAARRAEERAAMRIALEARKREREELRRRERERAGEWAERIAGELNMGSGNNERRRPAGEGRRSVESSSSGGGGGGGGGAKEGDEDDGPAGATGGGAGTNGNGNGSGKVTFLSKRQREAMKQRQQAAAAGEGKRQKAKAGGDLAAKKVERRDNGGSSSSSSHRSKRPRQDSAANAQNSSSPPSSSSHLTEAERMEIKRTYLGENAAASLVLDPREEQRRQLEAKKKKRAAKKITFKFAWDDADDTLGAASSDPLYDMSIAKRTVGRGRETLGKDGRPGTNRRDASRGGGRSSKNDVAFIDDVNTKPISEMTPRDWRILRENYDIRVRGGRAPPPLRTFREPPSPDLPTIHPAILDAVENTLNYREPSPIQRQAIPIGLQRRDLIGIAETGSGKTAAFGIPLCHYLLTLPRSVLDSVADEGPLALVMAPTRELALQIDVEIGKLLSRQGDVSTLAVVGGQAIQTQAYKLRQGVHVVVGTPGRINDCVETAYLVLNQCSYIVLDEADRMIDLGFAPQIEQILDSMGGSLKSEDEEVAYRQEEEDLRALMKKGGEGGDDGDGSGDKRGVPRHRLTAMFSATMPSEVERIAQRYLRHPAVVSIGDRDSVKNARIVQRVLFLPSAAKKENALRDILVRARHDEKIIVFVNEKKHAEGVGRMVERSGKRCVVLHGGKAQDQREESLEAFRKGGVVMVATDVAGRGLDIPNVSQVVNFDLPSRSIDNYCHRIGRTGRAGKEGLATSFITDADEGIMAPLKQYLESTGSNIPEKLARHPAAAAGGVLGGNLTV